MSEREDFGLVVECPTIDGVVNVLRTAIYRVPDPRTGHVLCIRQKVTEEVMLEAVEDTSGNVLWTPENPNQRSSPPKAAAP